MRCPHCGSPSSSVVDCRKSHHGSRQRRRRECKCGERYTTREVLDSDVVALERIAAEPRPNLVHIRSATEHLRRIHSALARAIDPSQSVAGGRGTGRSASSARKVR